MHECDNRKFILLDLLRLGIKLLKKVMMAMTTSREAVLLKI